MGLEIFKVILLGIVEGITEWLPISSTGHLILLEKFLALGMRDKFQEMFHVVVQLGAILAVIMLYFQRLNPFARKKKANALWIRVIIGCIPAGILGILLDDWLEAHFYNDVVVSMMLIIYGVLFLILEKRNRETTIDDVVDISLQTAFSIGIFQALSLIPGTSRSGATIVGAMLLGVSRYAATEFAFFMGIPIMVGASGVKLWKFFREGGGFRNGEILLLGIGCATAFLVSIIVIRYLLGYVKNKNFNRFGYYRIFLGIFVLLFFFLA